MPLRQIDIDAAAAAQEAAARDPSAAVRLVAGPGTGKSATIEERVRWLLAHGTAPERVFVISFTRASATELRDRIRLYCTRAGLAGIEAVSITTLHSLALRVLRRAGLLAAYPSPAGPMVLDDWELRQVFEAEFANATSRTPTRSREIRIEHEAFWSTGQWAPGNFIPPDPPISDPERTSFTAFHRPRTQTYSCVLPGEIVRVAVDQIAVGALDVRDLLDLDELIVDEFQDLNPADLEFINHLVREGARTFVAGDDDQSIYSFRFADPTGIQDFVAQHGATSHELEGCFRCTPSVLEGAARLIERNPLPARIPKHLHSLYSTAAPPLRGQALMWRFQTHRAEAEAIATSCQRLIATGVAPEQILILISDRRALVGHITAALQASGVPHSPPDTDSAKDTDEGRATLALLRVICDDGDYVALRLMLGLLDGVGLTTTNGVATKTVAHNLNYRDLFFRPLPNAVFGTREARALDSVRSVTTTLGGWSGDDTLAQRRAETRAFLARLYGAAAADLWDDLQAQLPDESTLKEVRDILWSDNDEQASVAELAIYERLGLEPPEAAGLPPRVRLMTMHRAKGLGAQVVFIPGLEEEIFPGDRRARYPGLVLEAARLLYVSMTRARAACIVSYARRRTRFGTFRSQTPSRFIADIGIQVEDRADGFSPGEADALNEIVANL